MVIVCFDTSAYGGPSWSWLALAVIAFALATWFGMVFGFALLTLNEVESHIRNSWSLRLALLLTIFATFAEVFYPNIKSSWGGGAPVNVTIFFTKDSVVKPGQKVTAQLIEESDQGFYVGAPKEAEALFIRRSDVALIYFSDKPSDSALLK